MKTISALFVFVSVPILLQSEELRRPVYPGNYPSRSFSSVVAQYGDPDVKEFGTGESHRKLVHRVIDRDKQQPALPPDLLASEEVLFCSWDSAPHKEECVWFRRKNGEWVSFWNSSPACIICGGRAKF